MGKRLDALLGRTFKSSKLRAVLHLATYRIAVLKCHRQSRYNHACAEVISLLKQGQTQRAIVRVEQVIEEQNMFDVFITIENYCNLLSERVRLIKLESVCPDELKEAMTSIIFAASRCEDFQELQKISKKLTSRYGKEFAAQAVGLPTNSGVNPEMVKKLSAKFPGRERRIKVLKDIAYENNISLQLDGSSPVCEVDGEHRHRQAKLDTSTYLGDFDVGENLSMPDTMVKYKRLSGSVKKMKNMSNLVNAASRWWNFPGLQNTSRIFTSRHGAELTDNTNKLRTRWGESPKMIQKLSTGFRNQENRMKMFKKPESMNDTVEQFEGTSSVSERNDDREQNKSQHKSSQSANFGGFNISNNLEMLNLRENNGRSSGPINAKKKYRDAADAAQEAAKSAAYAATAAKAALELYQAGSYDENDRRCNKKTPGRVSRKDNYPKFNPDSRNDQVESGHRRSQSAPDSDLEDRFLKQLQKAMFAQELNNEIRIRQGSLTIEGNSKLDSNLNPFRLSENVMYTGSPNLIKAYNGNGYGTPNIMKPPLSVRTRQYNEC